MPHPSITSSFFRMLLFVAILSCLQACPFVPPQIINGITLETIDPHLRPCQKSDECNNLRFTGLCNPYGSSKTKRCISKRRAPCDVEGSKKSCNPLILWACQMGRQTCKVYPLEEFLWGDCLPIREKTNELCNEIDDDCDGRIDESYNVGQTCHVGKGLCRSSGKFLCTKDQRGTVCDAQESSPQEEKCNNADDDCDGQIDEGLQKACLPEEYKGPPATLGVGACTAGYRICEAGQWSATCLAQHTPRSENCWNDQDDDCNGKKDREDPACDPCLPSILQTSLKGHTDTITKLAFSENGQYLFSSSKDGSLRIWEIAASKELQVFQVGQPIHHVALRPQSNQVALAVGSSVTFHTFQSNQVTQAFKTLTGHNDEVLQIAFSSDGNLLASGGADQRIQIWDTNNTSSPKQVLQLPFQQATTGLRFYQQNGSLAITNRSGYLYLYDPTTGRLQQRISHFAPIHRLTTDPKGARLAYASEDHLVSTWQPERSPAIESTPPQDASVLSIDMSLTGTTLAAAYEDGKILLWNLSRSPITQLRALQSLGQPILQVAFSPGQLTLASATQDHQIQIWRCPNNP